MVYFDANWYLYLFDEEQKVRHEAAHKRYRELYPEAVHDKIGSKQAQRLEDIAKNLPLSKEHRPKWDEEALTEMDMELVKVLPDVGDFVWDEEEKVHEAATPLFLICAEKK